MIDIIGNLLSYFADPVHQSNVFWLVVFFLLKIRLKSIKRTSQTENTKEQIVEWQQNKKKIQGIEILKERKENNKEEY